MRGNEGKDGVLSGLSFGWLRFSIFLIALGVFPSASSEGFSVSGVVIFEGKAPKPRVIDTRTDDDFCEAMYADTPLSADGAAIGTTGEFPRVFVWLYTQPAGHYPPPGSPLLRAPDGFRTLAVGVWGASSEAFFARAALPALVLIALSSLPLLLPELWRRRA